VAWRSWIIHSADITVLFHSIFWYQTPLASLGVGGYEASLGVATKDYEPTDGVKEMSRPDTTFCYARSNQQNKTKQKQPERTTARWFVAMTTIANDNGSSFFKSKTQTLSHHIDYIIMYSFSLENNM
jgi:hypothetical protein